MYCYYPDFIIEPHFIFLFSQYSLVFFPERCGGGNSAVVLLHCRSAIPLVDIIMCEVLFISVDTKCICNVYVCLRVYVNCLYEMCKANNPVASRDEVFGFRAFNRWSERGPLDPQKYQKQSTAKSTLGVVIERARASQRRMFLSKMTSAEKHKRLCSQARAVINRVVGYLTRLKMRMKSRGP